MEAALGQLIAAALAALSGWALRRAAGWLKAKTDNEAVAALHRALDFAVDTAVRDVEQSYSRPLRKANSDGKLSAGEKESAKMQALDKAVTMLGPNMRRLEKAIGAGAGAVLNLVSSRIEARVHALKLSRIP